MRKLKGTKAEQRMKQWKLKTEECCVVLEWRDGRSASCGGVDVSERGGGRVFDQVVQLRRERVKRCGASSYTQRETCRVVLQRDRVGEPYNEGVCQSNGS